MCLQDVTKSSDCKKFFDACMAKYGRINILVNNVGKSEPGGPVELSEQKWDEQVDVNLKSGKRPIHVLARTAASPRDGLFCDRY